MGTLNIISWNVNGIRSAERKGFLQWKAQAGADIIGLQEVRCDAADLPEALTSPTPHNAYYTHAKKKGYSGVGILSTVAPMSVGQSLGEARFDDEARMLETEFERFLLFNVYFPKGSGNERDNSRVPYKLDFYDAVFAHAKKRAATLKKPLIVMGDFNTAHQEIDLKNPKTNHTTSGFLPEEREAFGRHLGSGFVDSFRHLYPDKVQYTWWSQRPGVRARNVGWRIDYIWISQELVPHLVDATIYDQVTGSDHCPIGITLKW